MAKVFEGNVGKEKYSPSLGPAFTLKIFLVFLNYYHLINFSLTCPSLSLYVSIFTF
jgi:hypothetical protein